MEKLNCPHCALLGSPLAQSAQQPDLSRLSNQDLKDPEVDDSTFFLGLTTYLPSIYKEFPDTKHVFLFFTYVFVHILVFLFFNGRVYSTVM